MKAKPLIWRLIRFAAHVSTTVVILMMYALPLNKHAMLAAAGASLPIDHNESAKRAMVVACMLFVWVLQGLLAWSASNRGQRWLPYGFMAVALLVTLWKLIN